MKKDFEKTLWVLRHEFERSCEKIEEHLSLDVTDPSISGADKGAEIFEDFVVHQKLAADLPKFIKKGMDKGDVSLEEGKKILEWVHNRLQALEDYSKNCGDKNSAQLAALEKSVPTTEGFYISEEDKKKLEKLEFDSFKSGGFIDIEITDDDLIKLGMTDADFRALADSSSKRR